MHSPPRLVLWCPINDIESVCRYHTDSMDTMVALCLNWTALWMSFSFGRGIFCPLVLSKLIKSAHMQKCISNIHENLQKPNVGNYLFADVFKPRTLSYHVIYQILISVCRGGDYYEQCQQPRLEYSPSSNLLKITLTHSRVALISHVLQNTDKTSTVQICTLSRIFTLL